MIVQKYTTIDAIFSIHYSQIQNKVESEKHVRVRLSTGQTNPTLGVSSNIGCSVSEQCWMYQIFRGASRPYLFFVRTHPTWTYFEKLYI